MVLAMQSSAKLLFFFCVTLCSASLLLLRNTKLNYASSCMLRQAKLCYVSSFMLRYHAVHSAMLLYTFSSTLRYSKLSFFYARPSPSSTLGHSVMLHGTVNWGRSKYVRVGINLEYLGYRWLWVGWLLCPSYWISLYLNAMLPYLPNVYLKIMYVSCMFECPCCSHYN